jgi:hypothetical protein
MSQDLISAKRTELAPFWKKNPSRPRLAKSSSKFSSRGYQSRCAHAARLRVERVDVARGPAPDTKLMTTNAL